MPSSFLLVQLIHILDVRQPVVQQSVRGVAHGRLDTAAAVVAADDDVLHLEVFHRVVHHAEQVVIGVDHQVGHVTLHEDGARQRVGDFFGGHPAVGAADPQELRVLPLSHIVKQIGGFFLDILYPNLVSF